MVPNNMERLFDPICGMWLAPGQVAATYTYIGRTYNFCSAECRELFVRKPDFYVVSLAYDPEACIAHICPVQRANGADRCESPAAAMKGI